MILLNKIFDFYGNAKEKIAAIIDTTVLLFMHKLNLFHLYIVNRFGLNTTAYQFLTANDKAENIEEYVKALNDALENNKVKNIAISGSYGAGKSSFIKTFEKNNPQYRFLDISLATFGDKQTDLSLIEKSILEQMFYKVKNTTIPQSRLKKINRLKWIPIKIISVLLIVSSYFVLFRPQSFSNIAILEFLLEINSNDYLKYLPVIFLIMGAYYIVNKLLIIISNTNIEKLSLQNLELKSNSDSASLLNQYLDEILYFFEQTHFDVVVFQDLDRFENLDIFTKLRELNNFVNNSEQVAKKIVFIYAVKDEMFKNAHERTKFFDFLIPIIPYINATNSKDVLLDYFKDIEKSFLYDISLYISDMRLLKNIYNEYLIYNSNLDTKLEKTKLLAMIIYKNFEPQDFDELHKGKGLVYGVFKGKREHITSYIEEIGKNIDSIDKQINDIENEPKHNIKELRQQYVFEIIEKLGNQFYGSFYVNGNQIYVSQSIEDTHFQSIQQSTAISSRSNYGDSQGSVNFKDIEKISGNYGAREQLIIEKSIGKINNLNNEITKLKKEQEKLKDISIKELFEQFGDVAIFGSEDFENNELVHYLLSYGHIDENYEEYISNFFGVSITKDEQEFLRNVKNSGKAFPFDYELKNLQEIVQFRLYENEFNKESVLNLSLMEYLLENQSSYAKQVEKLFQQLSNGSALSKEFILFCLDNSSKRIAFVKHIVKHNQKFGVYIFQESKLVLEKQKEYFQVLLEALDKATLVSQNLDDSIKNFIEKNTYLPNYGENNDKFESIIKELQVKYKSLNTEDAKKVALIVDYIFKNDLYELNQEMIEHYFERFSIDTTRLLTSNFTMINEHGTDIAKELLGYIHKEINQYVENVLLHLPENTQESEESCIELLNIDSLDNELKLKIIEKEDVKIIDIDSIDKALWEQLIRHNKVISSWDNAFKYFNDSDSNNALLLNYLNIEENAKKISEIRCGGDYEKKNEFFNGKLLRFIIEANSFSTSSYEYLIKNLGYWYTDLDISKLDKEKVSLLIKYGRFQFKKACFDALKEKESNLHIALIEKNKDKLLEEYENFEFDTDDIIKILEIDKGVISDAIKKDLIEKVDYALITNKNIAKLIYKYIDRTNKKPIEYIKQMLKNLESLESKVNLVIEQNNGLDDNQFIQILDFLPEEYSKIKNFDGKQTVLKDNYYNQKLTTILKDRGFITSDKPDKKDQIRLYIKQK